ncbi:MAG: DHH family phosphoesterase [Candidatus Sumerlaeaceae bacterium]
MTLTTSAYERAVRDQPEVVGTIADIIRNNDDFLIVGHLRPDGDCLGSCLGLKHLLQNMGKKARFYTHGPLPDFFSYLPGFQDILTTRPHDCTGPTLCVDSADPERVHETFSPTGLVVNIDHHISNTCYGTVNWVDSEATAAGEQIYHLAAALDQPITAAIATCLYTALMTDTGGFRFSNTDDITFRVASSLVEAGADPAAIAEAVFDSRKPGAVKLTGEIYATLNYEFGGQFVWNEVTQKMFDDAGGADAEPEGLSSDLRSIQGVEVSVLLYETPEAQCRIGFRSRGKVNVAELAALLGGGGHHNASGALIREPYLKARDHALATIRHYLSTRL